MRTALKGDVTMCNSIVYKKKHCCSCNNDQRKLMRGEFMNGFFTKKICKKDKVEIFGAGEGWLSWLK